MTFMNLYRLRSERGQALVEIALVAPLLILMLMGIACLGYLGYCYVEVGNAANAAVHYATLDALHPSYGAGILAAAQTDAGNLTGVTLGTGTPVLACVCSDSTLKNSDKSTPNCGTFDGCVAPARLIDTVTVTVKATITTPFKLPGLPTSYAMQSSATMRVQE
jgi:Flp pilus assembly protein TadG